MSKSQISLDRFTLKSIAVAAMVIDHTAAVFFSDLTGNYIYIYYICRFIGRMTAPIMCFFAVEGFIHTSSRKRYILRMAVFALISQPFYTLAFYNTLRPVRLSMIFTLFVSLLMLEAWEKIGNLPIRLIVIGICIFSTVISDWYIFAPLMILGTYIMRKYDTKRLLPIAVVSIFLIIYYGKSGILNSVVHIGMLLAVVLLYFYNGERGRNSKWFFYIFYPTHLGIIYIANQLLGG